MGAQLDLNLETPARPRTKYERLTRRVYVPIKTGLEDQLCSKIVVTKNHQVIVNLARWHWHHVTDPSTSSHRIAYHVKVIKSLIKRLPSLNSWKDRVKHHKFD